MAAVYPGMPTDENPADTIEFLASEQPEQEGQIMRQKINIQGVAAPCERAFVDFFLPL